MTEPNEELPPTVRHQIFRKIRPSDISGTKGGGRLYNIRVFPPSNTGKFGFFSKPAKPEVPTTSETPFGDWFEYYFKLTGYYVERLNAYQFNLEGKEPPAVPQGFKDDLESLAVEMCIGEGHNPEKLIWPLNGVYVCDLQNTTGFKAVLVTSFECDPDYQLVTNCSVQLIQPVDAPAYVINNVSSSSSSLATSSSGAITE